MFDPIAKQWNEKLEKWAREVSTATREGKVAPDKPEFLGDRAYTAEDRFFAEVSFEGAVDNDDVVEHDAPFAIPKKQRESVQSAESKVRVAELGQELEQLKKGAPPEPPMACAVSEGETVEQRVFVRGSHQSPGDLVAKQFPVLLAGSQQAPITQGSGRKELAEWLTQPSHPLTARVMVNRIWQWHFGEGLVRTPDNFGATGEKPTHPLSRKPQAGEIKEAAHYIQNYPMSQTSGSDPGLTAWQSFCHILMASNEFQFVE